MDPSPLEIKRPDGGSLPENHHLEYVPDKKAYRMKIAVNLDGGRCVGKRMLVPLHTSDLGRAREMRDVVIVALSKSGVLSRPVLISESDEMTGGDDFSP